MVILQVELSKRHGKGNKNICYDNLWNALVMSNSIWTLECTRGISDVCKEYNLSSKDQKTTSHP